MNVALAKPVLPRGAVLASVEEIPGIAAVSGVAEDVLAAMTLRRRCRLAGRHQGPTEEEMTRSLLLSVFNEAVGD
ncbi:hypothetical protein ACGFZQ_51265 [Streptomyces sp. NPDC048254]|uniref:hypothetical protein n=1 Tax=Streptomyces sp. NPDC048254 TaxID=3365525 RepID=UPI003717C013